VTWLLVPAVLVLTVLVAGIELARNSKLAARPPLASAVVIYVMMLFIGNVAAAFLALPVARSLVPPVRGAADVRQGPRAPKGSPVALEGPVTTDDDGYPLEVYLLVDAFLGVFGFQGIIKNVNLSVYGKGILTIDDWISKARDNAVAASVEHYSAKEQAMTVSLAKQLSKLEATTLNGAVLATLGEGQVATLEALAAKEKADPMYIKAYAVAQKDPKQARAHLANER
jgi:hypothetical protein